MKEQIAPPVRERNEDFDELEVMISDLFKSEIYQPLMDSLGNHGDSRLLNSNRSFLLDQIAKGKISFYRGAFSGKFSAKTTRELKKIGAVWSKKDATFKLPLRKLPEDISSAIEVSATRFSKTVSIIREQLAKMLPAKIAGALRSAKIFSDSMFKTDNDISKSLKSITVSPQLSKKAREKIAKEYNHNMQRSIKGWTEKEIVHLRAMIEKEALGGKRYENLVNIIAKRYDVSQNKAKFLARQETGLMMAKFRESRYVVAGSA